MPQICLEYTRNIPDQIDYASLFHKIHQAIYEIIGINVANCKSRARPLDIYYIGDGEEKNAFIYMTIALMPGNTLSQKQSLSERITALVQSYYPRAMRELTLQIIIYCEELTRDTYFKFVNH